MRWQHAAGALRPPLPPPPAPPPPLLLPQLAVPLLAPCQLVELKNGETYNGHMVQCDTWMNIHLREVICTSKVRRRRWRRGSELVVQPAQCNPLHVVLSSCMP